MKSINLQFFPLLSSSFCKFHCSCILCSLAYRRCFFFLVFVRKDVYLCQECVLSFHRSFAPNTTCVPLDFKICSFSANLIIQLMIASLLLKDNNDLLLFVLADSKFFCNNSTLLGFFFYSFWGVLFFAKNKLCNYTTHSLFIKISILEHNCPRGRLQLHLDFVSNVSRIYNWSMYENSF